MKTAIHRAIEKSAGLFRAVAPIVTADQDERFRQIIREELASSHGAQSKQPSVKSTMKTASVFPVALLEGFSDELQKLAQMTLGSVAPKPTVSSQVTARMPRNTLSAKTPTYSQVNPAPSPGPAQMHQPVLSPPPVRG